MSLNIEPIENPKFTLRAQADLVELAGEIDLPDPGQVLKPFFSQIHEAMLTSDLRVIKVNIKQLTFINSSGIKEIVAWVLKQRALPPENRYQICFQSDPKVNWQKFTLGLMTRLGPDIKIET